MIQWRLFCCRSQYRTQMCFRHTLAVSRSALAIFARRGQGCTDTFKAAHPLVFVFCVFDSKQDSGVVASSAPIACTCRYQSMFDSLKPKRKRENQPSGVSIAPGTALIIVRLTFDRGVPSPHTVLWCTVVSKDENY